MNHNLEAARTERIQLILSKIRELYTKRYPIIFMGDFNSESNEERIAALKKAMDDSREVSQEKPFSPS